MAFTAAQISYQLVLVALPEMAILIMHRASTEKRRGKALAICFCFFWEKSGYEMEGSLPGGALCYGLTGFIIQRKVHFYPGFTPIAKNLQVFRGLHVREDMETRFEWRTGGWASVAADIRLVVSYHYTHVLITA